jgi:GNAT superfamily N-acetyltransferase
MRQQDFKILSVRENPDAVEEAIRYIQGKWASEKSRMVYDDCIRHCIGAASPLPQWYLLLDGATIIGCAGLITNDFISRMDLWPWVCALYIEQSHRGCGCGALLLEKAKFDARAAGYSRLYLCTDHTGYYEHYGFCCIGEGYHPWGERSRIYEADLQQGY